MIGRRLAEAARRGRRHRGLRRARVEEARDYLTFAHEDIKGLTDRWSDWRRARTQ